MESSTIKVVGQQQQGADYDFQVFNIPKPVLRSHDILIKVHAVALNPVDGKKRKSGWLEPSPNSAQNPLVLGYDGSGVVVAVGTQAKLFKVGDEVYWAGDISRQGSNAQYQAVDERIVGHKPKSLSFEQAASVPLVALTAWEALLENAHIPANHEANKGKSILIVGGAGGVGSFAIQIAQKVLGLTVIASASREESINYSLKHGADFTVNHRNPLNAELQKIGFKDGVNYIFNTVDMTEEYFNQFTAIVRPYGHIVGITGFNEQFALGPLFVKRASVSLELMFSRAIFGQEIEKQHGILEECTKLLDAGTFKHTAEVIQPFSLETLVEGHKAVESGTNIGKFALSDVDKFFEKL